MKRKIIYCILLMLIIIAVSLYLYLFLPAKVSLKRQNLTFEYGQQIQLQASDFLDTTDENILSSFKIDTIANEKNKSYPAVGEYPLHLEYRSLWKHYNEIVNIFVKDTIEPVIEAKEKELHITEGEKTFNYKDNFKIKDLSSCNIKCDTNEIDLSTPGKYKLHVTAIDTSKNKATLSIDVIVDEKVVESSTSIKQSQNSTSNSDTGSSPVHPSEITYVQGTIVVNKKHPLPASYAPQENPEAKYQLMQMITEMQNLGFNVSSQYSGYRSYAYQQSLYNSYVAMYGQAQADTFSARAGYSEHQTGLAFDLLSPNGTLLETVPEVNWVAQNAHRYGFIVRYQTGKENITGYIAEPWHLRYIGQMASDIYVSGLTLEEYLGVEGGSY